MKLKDGSCITCTTDEYYTYDSNLKIFTCRYCDIGYKCFGGLKFGPAEGYYRISTKTYNVIRCEFPQYCLYNIYIIRGSGNTSSFNPLGYCLSP